MPFILLAEKIGGICNFSPVKLLEIFFRTLSSSLGKGNSLSISVSKSNEGVVEPNLISPIYSLDSFINWSIILVFFPVKTTTTPDARGSKVPA